MGSVGSAIEVDGLTRYYRGSPIPALAGVSFTVAPGEIFGLLGPNGAGKTTTISILTGILRQTRGVARVLGADAGDLAKVRRFIGVAPQEVALYPTLTPRENLSFFGRVLGLRGKGLAARVEECLAAFAMTEAADRRVAACSGGMKRRINLAAGILHRPRLLFLDEPTVGIDVQSRYLILAYLREMNRTEGTTIVYTSHAIEEAEALCGHVVIIDHGAVAVDGAPADLAGPGKESPTLVDLFVRLTGEAPRD
jgi:ABC-2 type transport system ATP-binding protein